MVLAVASTLFYWFAYADNRRVTDERRTAMAGVTMPIPLNGFRPSLQGVLPLRGFTVAANAANQDTTRLLMVVRDSCPGSGTAVPQWIDWIRNSPNRGYSAALVSIEGTNHLSLLAEALAARGVKTAAWRVTQAQEFTLASGVSVTPAMVAMDSQGYVRLVSGTFSHSTRRALDQFLDSEGTGSAIR